MAVVIVAVLAIVFTCTLVGPQSLKSQSITSKKDVACKQLKASACSPSPALDLSCGPKIPSACSLDEGYTYAPTVNLCFKAIPDPRPWGLCLTSCTAEGGRLMVLDTDDRHNYMTKSLIRQGLGKATLWVGMNKTTINGPFKWLTGSTHTTLWDIDEPDYLSYQNCVYLDTHGLSDVSCSFNRSCLCERVLS